jgi:hypothetical protein
MPEALMRVALLLAVVALGLALPTQTGGVGPSGTPVARDPSGYCVSVDDRALLTRINQYFAHDVLPQSLPLGLRVTAAQ